MKRLILALAALAGSVYFAKTFAQQTPEKYYIEVDYLLYLPEGYTDDPARQWPLVVFLHGGGETGTDIEKVKANGLPMLVEKGEQFPFIGVSPQSRARGWDPRTVAGLTEEIAAKYNVDRNRMYLTGLSMGGHGTWNTATEYPGLFAAVAPICGGGDPSRAYTLAFTPVWNFHGDDDQTVPISLSDRMVEAVRQYNPDINYSVYPGVGHDSWTQTYENPEFWEWLLARSKYKHTAVEIPQEELERYTGTYRPADEAYRDRELTFWATEGKLHFTGVNGWQYEMYPAGDDTFFREADAFDFVKFERDGSGNVQAATMYSAGGMDRIERKIE